MVVKIETVSWSRALVGHTNTRRRLKMATRFQIKNIPHGLRPFRPGSRTRYYSERAQAPVGDFKR